MKKLNILFISSLVVLAACSSVPNAGHSDKKDSPETVEITYHIKLGMESQMQSVLSRAWTIYNKEHLVFAQPHTMVTTREYGNRPRIVETFTWVSHSAPDHAPKSVSDIWNEIQDLCEPRGGHDGVEMIKVPTMVPKVNARYEPHWKLRQRVRIVLMEKLTSDHIKTSLASVPEWKQKGDAITRTFQFKDFPAAMKFVNAVADPAEKANHHPDIDIRWNKVTLVLSTHDAGGLTEKDFSLAKQFDRL